MSKVCAHCDAGKTDGESPLCSLCMSIGVAKVMCEECGKWTGDYGFPDHGDGDGARCDDCLLGEWM